MHWGPHVDLALLAVAGLFAGYINTVAGAGSLLTLPALIFTGLSPGAANATNRVAVLFQTATAVTVFRRQGVRAGKVGLVLCIPATLSAAAGTYCATLLSDQQLRAVIATAMVVFLVLALWPRRAAPDREPNPPRLTPALVLGFTAIGFYAGFLQVGVGILVLLFMSLTQGCSLVAANGIKVWVILVLTAAALAVFAARGEPIDLLRGLVLACGTSVGGALGARDAVHRGERFVRAALALSVVASVVKLVIDGLS